jgi:hypothetical protein
LEVIYITVHGSILRGEHPPAITFLSFLHTNFILSTVKIRLDIKATLIQNKYRSIQELTMSNNNNPAEAAAFAVGGALTGGGVAATVGGIGLLAPAAGIAVGIGAAPVVAAGAVVGLAAYGIKKAFGW